MIICPIMPSAMAFLAFHHISAEVVCDPTCKTRLVSLTVFTSSRASSLVWTMGFSRYTSLPWSMASSAILPCQWSGVATITASTSACANNSR